MIFEVSFPLTIVSQWYDKEFFKNEYLKILKMLFAVSEIWLSVGAQLQYIARSNTILPQHALLDHGDPQKKLEVKVQGLPSPFWVICLAMSMCVAFQILLYSGVFKALITQSNTLPSFSTKSFGVSVCLPQLQCHAPGKIGFFISFSLFLMNILCLAAFLP